MAHLQNWFGLLPPDIATILSWLESLDKSVESDVPYSYFLQYLIGRSLGISWVCELYVKDVIACDLC